LCFRDADEEAARLAAKRREDRQKEKGIDRNEYRIEPVPIEPDENVLHREDNEKGGGDGPVIGADGSGQSHELPQCREGAEREEHHDPCAAG
jgi:hypothetical protein